MADDWVDLSAKPGHVARERARARALRSSDWWRQQLASGRCHYCGAAAPPETLTMDHVIPVSRGGRSVKGNVVPACKACNQSKRFLTPAEQVLANLNAARRHPLAGGGAAFSRCGMVVLVDPADTEAALAHLRDTELALHAILLTHNPAAAAAAVCERLRDETGCLVMGAAGVSTACRIDRELQNGERLHTPAGDFMITAQPDGTLGIEADEGPA